MGFQVSTGDAHLLLPSNTSARRCSDTMWRPASRCQIGGSLGGDSTAAADWDATGAGLTPGSLHAEMLFSHSLIVVERMPCHLDLELRPDLAVGWRGWERLSEKLE